MNQNDLRKLIEKYSEEFPDKNNKEIAELIILNEGVEYTVDYLKDAVATVIRSLEKTIHEDSKDSKSENSWTIYEENYIIKASKGEIKLTIEQADQIFYEYSKHGLDMSQMAIRNKHNIKVWEWHAIKRALWLYKDSNIFSPWTEDTTAPEDLKEMIRKKLLFKDQDKKRLIESEHDSILRSNFNKAIDENNRKEFTFRKIVDELNDVMPHVRVSPIKRKPIEDPAKISHLVVPIADIHIGSEVRNLRMTPNFDLDIAKKLMSQAADVINSKNADKVHLAFLGDLIESFTGLNHKGTWKDVAHGMYGSKVVVAAIQLLEDFLGKVNNIEHIYAVAGNHDRATSDYKEDDRGEIAELLFYMLKKIYGTKIPITFDPMVVSTDIDGINYIFAHGDKRQLKKDPLEFVFDNGRSDMYNVILSGHLHSRGIGKDNSKYRWIKCPSIFTGNWYSESNGWLSHPGLVLVQNNGYGLPVIQDVTLSLSKYTTK